MSKFIDMNAVSKFRDHYLNAVKRNPKLYRSSNTLINMVLPIELIEFAEAAAGHSGFGAGARPIGIRREVRNAQIELDRIFSSDDELATFILSSACDFDHVGLADGTLVTKRKVKKTVKVTLNNEEARLVFWKKFDKSKQDAMFAKYGKNMVQYEMMKLTWNEFDLRYGMEA